MKIDYHRYDSQGHYIRLLGGDVGGVLFSVFYTDTATLKVMKVDFEGEFWLPKFWDMA